MYLFYIYNSLIFNLFLTSFDIFFAWDDRVSAHARKAFLNMVKSEVAKQLVWRIFTS